MNLIKRTQELHSLYNNRELIIFTYGIEYFNNMANTYFTKFVLKGEPHMFDADFYRILWETENNKFFE